MAQDPTYIVKPHDFDALLRVENATELEHFLERPASYIAEFLTGAMAEGPKGWMVSGGRVVQGVLKAKLFEQFGREFRAFRKKGRIPDDFAEKKHGFQTWVELLSAIDSDLPDEDRLEALKAMFFAVNKVGASDGERVLGYQLFQIAKGLSSGQLLLLKECHEACRAGDFGRQGSMPVRFWLQKMAGRLGHGLAALIERDERVLMDNGLLNLRLDSGLQVIPDDARLTDLGLKFCENLKTYSIEKAKIGDPSEE